MSWAEVAQESARQGQGDAWTRSESWSQESVALRAGAVDLMGGSSAESHDKRGRVSGWASGYSQHARHVFSAERAELLGLGYSQNRQTGLAAGRFCAIFSKFATRLGAQSWTPKSSRPAGQDLGPADMGEGGLGGVEGDEDFLGRGEPFRAGGNSVICRSHSPR